MRTPRVHLTFCISIFSLVVCVWYATYIVTTFEEVIGFSGQRVLFEANTDKGCRSGRSVEVPEDLGDPCVDREAIHFLMTRLHGPYICPEDADAYLAEYPIFNTIITVKPKIVVTPVNTDDIRLGLQIAKHLNLTVTVRNGGHNPAGFSLSENGLVIDMAFFNNVNFVDDWTNDVCSDLWMTDYPNDAILAQGGCRWNDVHPLLEKRGVSVVGGGCATVGVAGLVLGGGIGWNSRYRGLVSDNVLAMRIVLPDGQIKVVDEQSDPELMWALRGAGGSNFGVVTDFVLQTHPSYKEYLAGTFYLERSPHDAEELIELYGDTIINTDIDHRLTMDLFLSRDLRYRESDRETMDLNFAVFFDGEIDKGIAALSPFLQGLSQMITSQEACRYVSLKPVEHSDLVVYSLYPSFCSSPDGIQEAKQMARRWIQQGGPFLQEHSFVTWAQSFGGAHTATYWTSGTANNWTSTYTKTLLDNFKYAGIDHVPSGMRGTLAVTLEHLGGAMGKGPSLWKHKDAKVMFSIQSLLRPPRTRRQTSHPTMVLDSLKRWTETMYTSLSPYFSGSYASYASPEMQKWEEKYYGTEAYNKLIKIKSGIKGSEIFNSPQRIQTPAMEASRQRSSSPTKSRDHPNPLLKTLKLERSSLQSDRSDLCPDWLLNTAVPMQPSDIPLHTVHSQTTHELVPLLEDKARIEDIRGRNVVLTGGSSGIGFAAVLHLLRLGANVIATSQSTQTCHDTTTRVTTVLSQFVPSQIGRFLCYAVSFDDITSVDTMLTSLSNHFHSHTGRVDVLILNAAHDGSPGWSANAAGVSKAVAVNHLGQFYLTLLLIQTSLLNIKSGRIVIQGSGAAFITQENDLIDLATQREDDPDMVTGQVHVQSEGAVSLANDATFRTYAATKAMNVAFALELARRLRSVKTYENLRVFLSVPPGTARTKLSETFLSNPLFLEEITQRPGNAIITPSEGALSCVYASTASLDLLDYPALTQFVAKEDFAHSTEEEMLGIERPDLRRLTWEYQRQPGISNYVLGCQVGSVAARFRSIDWIRTNTTCNLWNWSIEMINTASDGKLMFRPGTSPLGDLFVKDCHLLT